MKKRLLSLLLILAMIISAVSAVGITAGAEKIPAFATSGEGTETSPYIISTYDGLNAFADYVNGGQTMEGKYIKLADDFGKGDGSTDTLTSAIGDYRVVDDTVMPAVMAYFCGNFDGNGKEVRLNINMERSEKTVNAGFFGRTQKSIIKNLGVSGTVKGKSTSTDASSSTVYVGGLIGAATTTVTVIDCYSLVNVEAQSSAGMSEAGGLVGATGVKCSFDRCYATGDVTLKTSTEKNVYAGGLIGNITVATNVIITNCYATGNVTCTAGNCLINAGGLIGSAKGNITNCYAVGNISVSAGTQGTVKIGGVAGELSTASAMENCYAAGTLSATGGTAITGGVVCSTREATKTLAASTLNNCFYRDGMATYGVAVTSTSTASTPCTSENAGTLKMSEADMKLTTGAGALVTKLNGYVADKYSRWKISDSYPELSGYVAEIDTKKYYSVQAAVNTADTAATVVKLIGDSMENITVASNRNIVLDLCGNTLRGTGDGVVIDIPAGTLTLKDSKTGGKLCGGTGKIAGKSFSGGAVYIALNSVFNMEGGTITGNNVTGVGGGVHNVGTFNMSGGSITGNSAKRNGGGVSSQGKFTMTGGTITGNTTDGDGGGVYIYDDPAKDKSVNTVSGEVKITGNTKTDGTTDSNVFLPSGKVIIVSTDGLSKKALIGVTTKDAPAAGAPVSVTGENTADYTANFVSDSGYSKKNIVNGTKQVVAFALHSHDWTYKDHGTDSTVGTDTIKAVCNGTVGTCSSQDTVLTIKKPTLTTYGETGKSEKATLTATKIGGESVSADSIKYYKKTADKTAWESAPLLAAPTKAGEYKATITVGTGAAARTASVEYTIDKKDLTIGGTTVATKTYDGTTAASATAGTLSGTVAGDAVTLSISSAVFASKDAGDSVDVTVTYQLSGVDADNYSITETETLSADITPKQLTISSTAPTTVSDKTYDGTTTASATIGTVEGIVSGESLTVSVASASFEDKNAGTDKNVDVSYVLSGNSDVTKNYSVPESEQITADITAKAITVTAESKTTYVGSNLDSLTYTTSANALCGTDTFTGSLSTDADKSTVGTYNITQGTLNVDDGCSGNNYSITFNQGTYTVTDKQIQTLTFDGVTADAVSKTYGDDSFTEAVTGAETTVTYSSTDETVATVDSATGEVTILKAGTTVIKATAAENAEYAQAVVQYTLTVNKIKVDLPTAQSGLVYNGEEQTGVTVPTDAVYTVSGNTGTDAGSYNATATLNDKTNYVWNGDVESAEDAIINWSIDRLAVTVTANSFSIKLGESIPEFTAEVEGTLGEDTVSYGFAAVSPDAEGTYDIVPEGEAEQGNYLVTFVPGTLTVTEPDSTEPDDTKPDDIKPDDTKPDGSKADNTKPEAPSPKTGDTVGTVSCITLLVMLIIIGALLLVRRRRIKIK